MDHTQHQTVMPERLGRFNVRRHINQRLIFAFLLVALVPIAIIETLQFIHIFPLFTDQATDSQRSMTIILTQQLTHSVAELRGGLVQAGEVWAEFEPHPDKMARYLAEVQQRVPLYQSIWLMAVTGQEQLRVTSGQSVPANQLKNRREEEHFFKTVRLKPNETYFSSVRFIDGKPQLTIALPVWQENRLTGVIAAQIDLEQSWSAVTNLRIGTSGYAYLVDQYGSLVFSGVADPNFVNRERDLSNLPPVRAAFAWQSLGTVYQYTSPLGGEVLGSAGRVPGPGWILVMEWPTSEALQGPLRARTVALVVAVLALAAAIALGVALSRQITRPILALTRSARQIGRGDLNVPIIVEQKDEIGELEQALQAMTTRLREALATLEQRVEERTAELKEAQFRSDQANKAKTLFLSNMSHELRTPLNVIIGYTSSMLSMPHMYDHVALPSIYRKDIRLIMDNGEYLLGLINDILDLNKIEAGKLELRFAPIDLREICRGVVSTSIGLAKDKPVQIHSSVPADLPLIWGDPVRVRQIILNLMANAVKFTKHGSVTLNAHVEGGKVCISVIDTGIGIPEQSLPHIFDRFEQVANDMERSLIGTGLGLDISNQLTRMHGGTMTVKSQLGEGSTFSLSLPIAKDQTASAETAPERHEIIKVFGLPKQPVVVSEVYSVVVAVNETSTRRTICQSLKEAGYIVFDTDNVIRCMEMVRSVLPDLIIIAAVLADADDGVFFALLREEGLGLSNPIPIVLCGGSHQASNGLLPAVKAVLEKPIQIEQLLSIVSHTIEQSKRPESN